MKKIILSIAFAVGAFVVTNAQVTAVVGYIGANRTLNMESGINDVALRVQEFSSDKFNTLNEVNKIKDFIYNELAKEFPFTLLQESDILANEKYQTYVKEANAKGLAVVEKVANDRVVPEGYLVQEYLNPEEVIACFDGVNAVMVVRISLSLTPTVLVYGNGSAKAKILVNIKLLNQKSKTLMAVNSYSLSEQSFGIAAGQITSNRDNITVALGEASDNLFKDMRERLPKAIKKFEKKLVKYKM
ncbi:hypothetical protein FACS1894156_3770 [Bacteroidia bacterium]|nr:hypothetical protein FACS1894156_3770 [Bacteroidia bacterium]